ncbi:MAG: putative Membrane protein [Dehalococcoidales bacterium]|nr:putative Membrane protein [Dehalococcoidales bacterium]
MLGIVLAITAAFCWGTGAIFARLGLRHIKPSMGTLISMLSSLLLVGSLALITRFDDVRHLSPKALGWFGLIGVLNYLLGRQFNYMSIRYIGVTRATPLFAAAPFFAIILAVVFLGEKVNIPIILGTCAVVAGLYLVITSK